MYVTYDITWTHWLVGILFESGNKQWVFEINIGPLAILFSNEYIPD